MSTLLIKRLARSLWRTKLRLFAVVALVALGVTAGISFGSYAKSADSLYETIYADTEEGVNLPDLWVENSASTWNAESAAALCQKIHDQWPDSNLPLKNCEPRLKVHGLMFHNEAGNEKLIAGIWHGIDEGQVHRVWMPDHPTVQGRLAQTETEVVLDAHAVVGLDINVGDSVNLGAGHGRQSYTVVGIGFHGDHLYFAPPGSIIPATAGTLAAGYMTAAGLERLTASDRGTSNFLLLDIEGTPQYDLLSTAEVEGAALAAVVAHLAKKVTNTAGSPTRIYDRSTVQSVELLRADAEGAMVRYPYITGMLAIVAGITIFLSLQRLIQSQAREIAILRTLGVGRKVLMPAYIIAPLLIGAVGALIGVALGVGFGAPAMRDMYEAIIGVPVVVDGLDGGLVWQNVLIALAVVFLSGIRPAWQASKLQPLDVLRGQHEVRLSSRRIQRWTSRLPATVGLTIRSSIRKPVRLLFTFIGVGLSMLIFGSMLLMMGSIEDLAVGGFAEKESWDAQVQVPIDGENAVTAWADAKGAKHETLLQFPATPKDDPRQFIATGHSPLTTEIGASLSLVKLKEGRLPLVGAETTQVLIDEGTAHFLEWKTGEKRLVVFGPISKEVEISGITSDEMTRSVHFHRADLAKVVGLEATSVMIELPEGIEIDAALGDLSTGIVLRQDTLDTFATLMDQQKKFFNAILFLGILIAIVVLFNTLLMNLAERDSELATLRVLGAPIKRLGWMLFFEHLAIGLAGGILGCIFSVLGTAAMISASAQWSFYFTVEIQWSVLASLIGIVVAISVSLTPLGMRRIRKMDLVEKVKAFSS
jgi:putative ABC transport system permease protein